MFKLLLTRILLLSLILEVFMTAPPGRASGGPSVQGLKRPRGRAQAGALTGGPN